MARRSQLLLLCFCATILTSAASYLISWWIGVETTAARQSTIGASQPNPPVLVLGSSLTFFGISFPEISTRLSRPIITRSAASASASELEQLAKPVPPTQLTIIGLSAYDQNETILSDFRADLVPIRTTIRDLWMGDSGWAHAKRVLGQYPQHLFRTLFPTAGRSVAIMTGIRDKLFSLLKGGGTKANLVIDPHYQQTHPESLADWSQDRLLNNLSLLRTSSQGVHRFSGAKSLALDRLIRDRSFKGEVIVVVLPLSPTYKGAFLEADSGQARFEFSLDRVRKAFPAVRWLRLDQQREFDSDAVFWDLAHLNDRGRDLATKELLQFLGQPQ